ncbi:hypothetical protein TCELL_0695 [Thermogladius calderae 1633]|uniref:Uncharacterized protein n=1 Tax=Thermogladius calderae (strain DSM 22663 / VKM B-2946 / 1633) TaxID=1184251 RepID=I3TED1_THEC1|nr:hypothetical protein [Thermogladius calderae]AFK51119.1 hypothetical protein TCELL_0695 [Thermogladius calderae 1633]
MEIIVELPSFSRKGVDKLAPRLKDLGFSVFLPENPAGIPALLAAAVGVYLRTKYELGVYISTRLVDVNLLYAYSTVLTAKEFGFKGVTLLRGDKPAFGETLETNSEEALAFIKERVRGVDLGLIVSMRFSMDNIQARLLKNPDYVMVIHFGLGNMDKMVEVSKVARERGVKVYPFVLLSLEKSKGLFMQLGQPFVETNQLRGVCESLKKVVDGIVVSSPLDLDTAVEQVARLCF